MTNENEVTPWYVEIYQRPGTTTHQCLKMIADEAVRRHDEMLRGKIEGMRVDERTIRGSENFDVRSYEEKMSYNVAIADILVLLDSQTK